MGEACEKPRIFMRNRRAVREAEGIVENGRGVWERKDCCGKWKGCGKGKTFVGSGRRGKTFV